MSPDPRAEIDALVHGPGLLSQVLDAANDAIIIDDEDGAIVYMNQAFLDMFGFGPEVDPRALRLEDYVHPDDRARLRDRHDKRVAGVEVPQRFEYRGVRTDGTELRVEVTVTSVQRGDRVVGTHSTLRDVTERVTREERDSLSQRMESVGRVATGFAHDFNNILGGVMAHLEIADEELSTTGVVSESRLAASRQGLERAADMVRQLVSFARHGNFRSIPTRIDPLVREAVALLQGRLETRPGLELAMDLGSAFLIKGDPSQIHQILQNLILNAVEATPERGQVSVRTEDLHLTDPIETRWAHIPPGDYVRLCVADEGTGMSPEVMRHVLEPFFTTKTGGGNSGIGLATVYAIVQRHGAHLDLESKEGEGTRFSLYFPRHAD